MLICSMFSAAANQCDLKTERKGQTAMSFVTGRLSIRAFIIPEWFAITPYGSCIYYIWNSVVFLFNTEWGKYCKGMRPELHPWRLSPLNVKDSSYSVTSFSIQHILFWQLFQGLKWQKRLGLKRQTLNIFSCVLLIKSMTIYTYKNLCRNNHK